MTLIQQEMKAQELRPTQLKGWISDTIISHRAERRRHGCSFSAAWERRWWQCIKAEIDWDAWAECEWRERGVGAAKSNAEEEWVLLQCCVSAAWEHLSCVNAQLKTHNPSQSRETLWFALENGHRVCSFKYNIYPTYEQKLENKSRILPDDNLCMPVSMPLAPGTSGPGAWPQWSIQIFPTIWPEFFLGSTESIFKLTRCQILVLHNCNLNFWRWTSLLGALSHQFPE